MLPFFYGRRITRHVTQPGRCPRCHEKPCVCGDMKTWCSEQDVQRVLSGHRTVNAVVRIAFWLLLAAMVIAVTIWG